MYQPLRLVAPLAAVVLLTILGCAQRNSQPTAAARETDDDFALQSQRGKVVHAADLRGQWTVIYFYPKDDTPGCTIEAKEFSAAADAFSRRGVRVLGVNNDPVASHAAFCDKHDLRITLLADPDRKLIDRYHAWDAERGYTRRITILLDANGQVAHRWDKVNPRGHAQEVLAMIDQLKQ